MINLLEPPELVELFRRHPPEGFAVAASGGPAAFRARFDLATTLDPEIKRRWGRLLRVLPRPRCLFVGTTVTEHAPFPDGWSPREAAAWAEDEHRAAGAPITIVKDLPEGSPLVAPEDEAWTRAFRRELEARGFESVSGEALAYVPIDFASVEDLLSRFSRARRKNLRRKLRPEPRLNVREEPLGSDYFEPDATCAALYALYRNTYDQSEIHFDLLTRGFFDALFRGRMPGVVFLYEVDGRLAGFNICLDGGPHLVDKYIGFDYGPALEHGLYFRSWFRNLEYCLRSRKTAYVAGWTDPKVKAELGASFAHTVHMVRFRSPLLQALFRRGKGLFEGDRIELERAERLRPAEPPGSRS